MYIFENNNYRKASSRNRNLEAYFWSLRDMLFMCELVIVGMPGGKIKTQLRWIISYHYPFFEHNWEDWKHEYSPKLLKLVSSVLDNPKEFGW